MSIHGLGVVLSESLHVSVPVSTSVMPTFGLQSVEKLDPMPLTLDHMIVMMGRVESSLNEVVKAVTPQGLLWRPDAAPPYGRPELSQSSFLVQSRIPSLAWTPAVPPSQNQRRPWEPPLPQFMIAQLPIKTSLPDIFVPQHSLPVPTSHTSSYPNLLWTPLVTPQYGPSSWDPPLQQSQSLHQPIPPSSWDIPALRKPTGQLTLTQQPLLGPSCWDIPVHPRNSALHRLTRPALLR